METRAPAVVAIVVTTGAAPGLEATLSTLVGQRYDQLSILVMANGADTDVVHRVAGVAPAAFVKVLDVNRGFAAACNEAVLMVEGASFLLFCHDDVMLFDGAVQNLVEAAFRANAGIVTPKVVAYDDPFILVHVGQVADRFGTVRERVELGEIDHGQQDLERDVFVAPGGVTLVRTDLFETVGGFDPLIPALGEDLDLCWRAQVAGARVVVAPSAVIAHRQTVATGERPVLAVGTRLASRRELQRRHQLAAVLTCWSRHTLLSVVPTLLALDLGETVVALLGRDPERARAVVGSWRWVLKNRRHLVERRHQLARIRVLKDAQVIQLQVGGASRLKTFLSTLGQEGLDRARGVLPDTSPETHDSGDVGVGFAAAFQDDDAFDVIAEPERPWRPTRALTTGRSQLLVVAAVAVLWLVGTRNLVNTPLPVVGRLAPLGSWWGMWRHFFSSWSPNGVGTGTPAPPGYGVLAFVGTFVAGRMGVLPRAALVLAGPVGAVGVWRLLVGTVSHRARLAGAVAYLAFPLVANMVEGGRVDVLAVAALLPFALRRALALLRAPGFSPSPAAPAVAFGHRGWAQSEAGQTAVLVVQVATMTALAPAALVVIELAIAAAWLSSAPGGQRLHRPLRLAVEVLAGTAVLLLPLSFDTLAAGPRALSVFGLPSGQWTAATLSQLVRGATGSFGGGWGGWLIPAAALAGCLLARGERTAPARTLAVAALAAVALASAVGRGWLGSFAPDVAVLEVLLAVAVAGLVAVAVSAVESDVGASARAWRRGVAILTVAAVLVAVIPLVAQLDSGRFSLPTTGTPETLGRLSPDKFGGFRVLWLGEPAVLPVPGWSVEPGLAAATTTNSLPTEATLFTAPDPGAAQNLIGAVADAARGATVRLGQLLAAAGVSTIVVMTQAAPTLPGLQRVPPNGPPAALVPSLERQSDLILAAQSPGVFVFSNTAFHGVVSERDRKLASNLTPSDPNSAAKFVPVMDYAAKSGYVAKGTMLVAIAPASAFELSVNGRDTPRSVSLGGDAVFTVPAGEAKLVLHQLPLNAVLAALTMALWLVLALGFGALAWFDQTARRRRGIAPAVGDVEP